MADIDLSTFVPDTFKGEDGNYDTGAFRTAFDEATAFRSAEDERRAALPKDAADYAFVPGSDHAFPEGFNADDFRTPELDDKGQPVLDKDGNPKMVDFDLNKAIDPNDPDIPLVQSILKDIGAPAEAGAKLASILLNRELRGIMESRKVAASEKEKLGPDSKARIEKITTHLNSALPASQAKAVADTIVSADALRGIEALIQRTKPGSVIPKPDDKTDLSELPPRDRIMAGMKQRTA